MDGDFVCVQASGELDEGRFADPNAVGVFRVLVEAFENVAVLAPAGVTSSLLLLDGFVAQAVEGRSPVAFFALEMASRYFQPGSRWRFGRVVKVVICLPGQRVLLSGGALALLQGLPVGLRPL